ncbi:potassium voltage-gated channel subfamily A member 1-like [Mizuhopecten yessoensis]|uniref:Potassium voltage-gated channel subfamily A member 1 n=1 Tax=Mizuhopecten yessoensis TaxID=6573 RepID=A0A210PGW5_MIZYE|nr:potassium voltage-gated channel subfamily A member 1-like [Mizuhopecten yessoensis]OWF35707.1 Potassium voltage-gated channel subfamily A member 1 [Mizuhopecten yessoensis]
MHIINQNTVGDGRGYLQPPSNHHEKTHFRSSSTDSNWKDLFSSHSRLPGVSCGVSEDEDDGGVQDMQQAFVSEEALAYGHECDAEGCRRITINVSGLKFETQLRTLNRLPHTLLGDPTKRKKYWDSKREEFFFDRHRPSFPAILYFYQSGGRLKRPMEVPSDIFLSEMQFFELGKSVLKTYKVEEGYIVSNTEAPELPEQPFQRKVWELFEYPDSSVPARVLAILSVIVILVSVTTFCVETLPDFHGTECITVMANSSDNSSSVVVAKIPNYEHPLFLIEAVCICWFSIELVCRLLSSPSKKRFLKDLVNWIDFASIMPFFLSMGLYLISHECGQSKSGFLSVLRVLRVSRILKLSKHSVGLQILGKTMQTSISELVMFALFLGIGIIISSGAMFYAELPQPNSQFKSIPDAFWWSIVSMTTVGYGDMYPCGAFGKIVGSMTVISGILSIALPVPVIVANFNTFYRQSQTRSG